MKKLKLDFKPNEIKFISDFSDIAELIGQRLEIVEKMMEDAPEKNKEYYKEAYDRINKAKFDLEMADIIGNEYLKWYDIDPIECTDE